MMMETKKLIIVDCSAAVTFLMKNILKFEIFGIRAELTSVSVFV